MADSITLCPPPVAVLGSCASVSSLAEVSRRNLFEDGSKIERGLLTERALEAALRSDPVRAGVGGEVPPGACQRYGTAASILLGHVEPHKAALLERAQKVPQRQAVHDQ